MGKPQKTDPPKEPQPTQPPPATLQLHEIPQPPQRPKRSQQASQNPRLILQGPQEYPPHPGPWLVKYSIVYPNSKVDLHERDEIKVHTKAVDECRQCFEKGKKQVQSLIQTVNVTARVRANAPRHARPNQGDHNQNDSDKPPPRIPSRNVEWQYDQPEELGPKQPLNAKCIKYSASCMVFYKEDDLVVSMDGWSVMAWIERQKTAKEMEEEEEILKKMEEQKAQREIEKAKQTEKEKVERQKVEQKKYEQKVNEQQQAPKGKGKQNLVEQKAGQTPGGQTTVEQKGGQKPGGQNSGGKNSGDQKPGGQKKGEQKPKNRSKVAS